MQGIVCVGVIIVNHLREIFRGHGVKFRDGNPGWGIFDHHDLQASAANPVSRFARSIAPVRYKRWP